MSVEKHCTTSFHVNFSTAHHTLGLMHLSSKLYGKPYFPPSQIPVYDPKPTNGIAFAACILNTSQCPLHFFPWAIYTVVHSVSQIPNCPSSSSSEKCARTKAIAGLVILAKPFPKSPQFGLCKTESGQRCKPHLVVALWLRYPLINETFIYFSDWETRQGQWIKHLALFRATWLKSTALVPP